MEGHGGGLLEAKGTKPVGCVPPIPSGRAEKGGPSDRKVVWKSFRKGSTKRPGAQEPSRRPGLSAQARRNVRGTGQEHSPKSS